MDDVLGHTLVIRLLQATLCNGRLSQAYLFWGMPGVGKRTLAGVFARALLCDNPDVQGACGRCRSCRLADGGNNPDWHILGTDETPSLLIAEVRALQQALRYKPYGRRHIITIHRAERLTTEAANAILKTLEEPEGETVFLLTSDQVEMLPLTVRSRCLSLPCRPLTRREVLSGLDRAGVKGSRAAVLAARAEGSLGRALALAAGGEDGNNELASMVSWAGEIGKMKVAQLLETAERLKGREQAERYWSLLAYWLRDLLLWKETGNEEYLVHLDFLEDVQKQSRRYAPESLVAAIRGVEEARRLLGGNVNPRMINENLLLKLNSLPLN